MPIKTILLCLTSPSSAETLLRATAPIAQRFGSHLVGLHTLEALVVYPAISMHIPDEGFVSFNNSQKAQSDEIKAIFDRYTRNEDLISEWRLVRPDTKTAAAQFVDCARAADLVIMTMDSDDTDWPLNDDVVGDTIRDSGRPVIIIPEGYIATTIGENILLGWNATRETTHAAHDLVTIAAPNASVVLLTIGNLIEEKSPPNEARDLANTYCRHGLKAEIVRRPPQGQTVAEIILNEARDRSSDLIVTGVFEESRGYDPALGAATSHLLRSATVPVLCSR